MKLFFFMFLLICSYVISQTTVQGRITNLRKQFLPISSGSGHYRADGEVPYFELHRRQAGWGKRSELLNDDENDDVQFEHIPSTKHDDTVRTWFDDK